MTSKGSGYLSHAISYSAYSFESEIIARLRGITETHASKQFCFYLPFPYRNAIKSPRLGNSRNRDYFAPGYQYRRCTSNVI